MEKQEKPHAMPRGERRVGPKKTRAWRKASLGRSENTSLDLDVLAKRAVEIEID